MTRASVNRQLYDTNYPVERLEWENRTAYDRHFLELRLQLIKAHGETRDVLEVGCGTGAFVEPAARFARQIVGLDFSARMLQLASARLPGDAPLLVQGDAAGLPFAEASFDLVYSFATLYIVPDLAGCLREAARVLRSGGVAVLELGNRTSVNSLVSAVQHRYADWSQPHYQPYAELVRAVNGAGFEVEDWRAFQLLPMSGVPRRLLPLAPLLTAAWKRVLGRRLRGRMLDEWLSSAPFLRRLAFRHIVVLRKP